MFRSVSLNSSQKCIIRFLRQQRLLVCGFYVNEEPRRESSRLNSRHRIRRSCFISSVVPSLWLCLGMNIHPSSPSIADCLVGFRLRKATQMYRSGTRRTASSASASFLFVVWNSLQSSRADSRLPLSQLCGLYYWIWVVLLPKLGGYEIIEEVEELQDGARLAKLVRRYTDGKAPHEPEVSPSEQQPLLNP